MDVNAYNWISWMMLKDEYQLCLTFSILFLIFKFSSQSVPFLLTLLDAGGTTILVIFSREGPNVWDRHLSEFRQLLSIAAPPTWDLVSRSIVGASLVLSSWGPNNSFCAASSSCSCSWVRSSLFVQLLTFSMSSETCHTFQLSTFLGHLIEVFFCLH